MAELLCIGMVCLLAAGHVYQNIVQYTHFSASDCIVDNQAKCCAALAMPSSVHAGSLIQQQ